MCLAPTITAPPVMDAVKSSFAVEKCLELAMQRAVESASTHEITAVVCIAVLTGAAHPLQQLVSGAQTQFAVLGTSASCIWQSRPNGTSCHVPICISDPVSCQVVMA